MAISPTLAINNLTKERLSQGLPTYKLGFGQSPFPVPEILRKELQDHAHVKDYLHSQGLLELREKISEYYHRRFGIESIASNIIVGPGSKELLFLTQLILNRELILPKPSWVSYAPQANLLNNATHWLNTSEDNNWNLSAEELDSFLASQSGRSRHLIILNYPNNPTGQSYNEEELILISEVARKYDLVVISDEIYGEFDFKARHVSIAKYHPKGTIVCSGLSKWCGAGGWRLGYMIFPDSMNEELQALISAASECYSCASAPIQYASIKAFENGPEIQRYTDVCRKILIKAHDIVINAIDKSMINVFPADGGFYVFLNFKAEFFPFESSKELCERLLNDTGVALLPGSSFGCKDDFLSARLAFVDIPEIDFDQILNDPKLLDQEGNAFFNSLKNAIFSINNWSLINLPNK